jgi:hypothetical protein
MSVHSGTDIVTNGLVYGFDASNTRSYPGSGTTLTDLSGNNIIGTLTNSPTWNTISSLPYADYFGNLGAGYIPTTNSFGPIPTGTSSRTIILGVKTPSVIVSGNFYHMLHYGTNFTDSSYGLVIYNRNLANHTWGGTSICSSSLVAPSTNYIFAVTFNNASSPRNTFWINGIQGTTGYSQGKTADYTINTGTTYNVHLGTRIAAPAEQWSDGRIYFGYIYNRALTDSEIKQNYNALKSRIIVDNLSTNLVGYWDASLTSSYSGTGTTWNDLSIFGNNGTLVNSPTWNSNGYFDFNGSSQYVTLEKDNIPFGRDPGTISVWAKTNTYGGGWRWVLSYGANTTSNGRALGINGGTFYFSGFTADISASGVPLNTWFNLVGVYDGLNASMYLNGNLIAGPTQIAWYTQGYNVQIGRQVNNLEYWSGSIAQCKIHNRALTSTEILYNFNELRENFGV